ncbi:MAG: hypothetical protein LLG06_10915, partial [Desulfobacteraceae bacterium]|nr:hypothetical protein [Desulfobacteraceae bacterium]
MEFGSEIRTLRNALIEKIKAALGPHVLVDRFAGEERAKESACPSVYIQYVGGIARESEEIGAVTYQYDTIWLLHIQTEDADHGSDGDEQAAAYLEAIRRALHGT